MTSFWSRHQWFRRTIYTFVRSQCKVAGRVANPHERPGSPHLSSQEHPLAGCRSPCPKRERRGKQGKQSTREQEHTDARTGKERQDNDNSG
jgi:hypothetical protein